MQPEELTQPPEEETTSFDKLEESIQANKVLYDRLHQSLIDEVVATVEDEDEVQHYKDQQKTVAWDYLKKL